jgi:hypothetical protein
MAELGPGKSLQLDLSVKDGETVLIIRRAADGTLSFPMFTSSKSLSEPGVLSEIIRICRDSIAQIEAKRN